MPKYHAPTPGAPMGFMRPDPMLSAVKKEGPSRGYSGREIDKRIASSWSARRPSGHDRQVRDMQDHPEQGRGTWRQVGLR
jgi:hypothetical protein